MSTGLDLHATQLAPHCSGDQADIRHCCITRHDQGHCEICLWIYADGEPQGMNDVDIIHYGY